MKKVLAMLVASMFLTTALSLGAKAAEEKKVEKKVEKKAPAAAAKKAAKPKVEGC